MCTKVQLYVYQSPKCVYQSPVICVLLITYKYTYNIKLYVYYVNRIVHIFYKIVPKNNISLTTKVHRKKHIQITK